MLIILDWDGTLMDSTAKIVSCMQQSARQLDLTVLNELAIKEIIGLGLPQAIRQLYPALDDQSVDAFRDSYSRNFVAADEIPCSFFPGVKATLASLRDDGHALAIATGKSRKGLDRVLGNLDMQDWFDGSRCADETASKPDPLMLVEILDELGFSAEQAVMVGDTEFDMAMAVNAQMPRIAVDYGAHHIDRLKNYQPSLCVDHFAEILEWSRGV